MTQDLPRLLLAALAASDALAPRAMGARDLAAQPSIAADEFAIERALRALHEDGLVDAFHEPYIASRYQITRKGRDSLG